MREGSEKWVREDRKRGEIVRKNVTIDIINGQEITTKKLKVFGKCEVTRMRDERSAHADKKKTEENNTTNKTKDCRNRHEKNTTKYPHK